MKPGDLIAYEPQYPSRSRTRDPHSNYISKRERTYGLVVEESNGYVKIRWNDGSVTVMNGQTIVKDSFHRVFTA